MYVCVCVCVCVTQCVVASSQNRLIGTERTYYSHLLALVDRPMEATDIRCNTFCLMSIFFGCRLQSSALQDISFVLISNAPRSLAFFDKFSYQCMDSICIAVIMTITRSSITVRFP